MIARREFVLGAAAAGVVMQPLPGWAKASQPATNVNFEVPEGACDCHTHIHGDPAKFPWFAGRTYTPEMALPEEMTALHKVLKIQRVVIVTPSVYGADNSATIYGLAARANRARGVAVIDDKATDAELDRLASLGFKGIRLNLSTAGIDDPQVATERFLSAAARVKSRGWHIQLNTTLPVIAAMKDALAASPVTLVAGVRSLRQRKRGTRGGATRLLRPCEPREIRESLRQDFDQRRPARKLRLLHPPCADADWRQCRPHSVGTNWPHPNSVNGSVSKVTPLWPVDDGVVLNLLPVWAPAPAVRKKILVDNPARLYEF